MNTKQNNPMNKHDVLYYTVCFILSIFLIAEIKLLNNSYDLRERKIIYLLATGIFYLFYLIVFVFNFFKNRSVTKPMVLSFFWVLFLIVICYNSLIKST